MPYTRPRRLRERRSAWVKWAEEDPISHCRYDIVAFVMLAALGLSIVPTIPLRTHAIAIDLPLPGDVAADWIADEPATRVGLTREGTATLNGVEVAPEEFADLLEESLMLPIEPLLVFDPHPDAAYGDAARLLATIRATGIMKFCFARAESRETFGSGEYGRLYFVRQEIRTYPRERMVIDLPPFCPEEIVRSEYER